MLLHRCFRQRQINQYHRYQMGFIYDGFLVGSEAFLKEAIGYFDGILNL